MALENPKSRNRREECLRSWVIKKRAHYNINVTAAKRAARAVPDAASTLLDAPVKTVGLSGYVRDAVPTGR
jgi:hypothetical protein